MIDIGGATRLKQRAGDTYSVVRGHDSVSAPVAAAVGAKITQPDILVGGEVQDERLSVVFQPWHAHGSLEQELSDVAFSRQVRHRAKDWQRGFCWRRMLRGGPWALGSRSGSRLVGPTPA